MTTACRKFNLTLTVIMTSSRSNSSIGRTLNMPNIYSRKATIKLFLVPKHRSIAVIFCVLYIFVIFRCHISLIFLVFSRYPVAPLHCSWGIYLLFGCPSSLLLLIFSRYPAAPLHYFGNLLIIWLPLFITVIDVFSLSRCPTPLLWESSYYLVAPVHYCYLCFLVIPLPHSITLGIFLLFGCPCSLLLLIFSRCSTPLCSYVVMLATNWRANMTLGIWNCLT